MGANFIEFPKLGIKLFIEPVAFQLGNLTVRWYGIIIAAAIMLALSLALRQAKRFRIKDDDLIDMFLIALPVSILFARLFFVVFKWDMFKNDLLGIFRVWEGGVAIYGAVIGAVLSLYIFSRIRKTDMWLMADFACVYLPLAQAIGRWGNFINQELYGTNTDLPWGMTGSIIQIFPDQGVDPSMPVHPTFLYESLWNMLVFVILLRIRKHNKIRGGVFASYLALYSLGRFLAEMLRVDDFQAGAIRYNQAFALVVFIGAAAFLVIAGSRARKAALSAEEGSPSAYADVISDLDKDDGEALAEKTSSNDSPVDSGDNGESGEEPRNNDQ